MNQQRFIQPFAAKAPFSGIYEAIDYGRGRPGLIPLWTGEGDSPTPDFIARPAAEALMAGETFYTWQLGLPELRSALSRYYQRHYGRTFPSEEFVVTSSGMHAIRLVIDLVASSGDDLVYISPAWPNFDGAATVAGVNPIAVPLRLTDEAWTLDLAELEQAITPRTRVLFINSPSNPTGWTASRETLAAILELARRKGVWIIADEIYGRFCYGDERAPSFLDMMADDDRILFVNSFSKNWAMTGWRIGWMRLHPSLLGVLENLIQYSTSGVPQFLQRGAVAALDHGDEFVRSQVEQARQARDTLCNALRETGRARFAVPHGAFYLFFTADGITDSMTAVRDLIDRANIGLAPGSAFGAAGNGFMRLCYLRRQDQIEDAAGRICDWLMKR